MGVNSLNKTNSLSPINRKLSISILYSIMDAYRLYKKLYNMSKKQSPSEKHCSHSDKANVTDKTYLRFWTNLKGYSQVQTSTLPILQNPNDAFIKSLPL